MGNGKKALNAEHVDRDQQILSRLSQIQNKVDSLEQTTAFALRADSDRHFDSVKKIFGKNRSRARVYLAIDGERTVQEVAKHLSMQSPNVSPELKILREEGLIEMKESTSGGDIYGKTPLDRTLQITKKLSEAFGLSVDGKESKSKVK